MFGIDDDWSSKQLTLCYSDLLKVDQQDRKSRLEEEEEDDFHLETHNLIKDMFLISSLFVSLVGCIYAFVRQRRTQENMNIMLKELETLQQAEGNLLAVTEKYTETFLSRNVKSQFLYIWIRMRTKNKIHVNQNLLHKWLIEVQRTKVEKNRWSILGIDSEI